MTNIYASDLAKSKQNDEFMGAGFEDLVAKADAQGGEVIVGVFLEKPYID